MNKKDNVSPIGESWSSYRANHYTSEEIAENDLIVDIIGEIVKARNEKNISQRELESISGVKQPVIARMENGKTDPRLSTIVKVLTSLDKKVVIEPINKK